MNWVNFSILCGPTLQNEPVSFTDGVRCGVPAVYNRGGPNFQRLNVFAKNAGYSLLAKNSVRREEKTQYGFFLGTNSIEVEVTPNSPAIRIVVNIEHADRDGAATLNYCTNFINKKSSVKQLICILKYH